ncbi:MAG TPA: ATP synthase subunit I [Polyangiales bacterium]|nr:ATP synthase subunit I [Polyangiales bacterium]
MTDAASLLQLLGSLLLGALLGVAFFWGLWITVRGLRESDNPALRTMGSLALRFGLVLATFFVLTRYAGWKHALAAAVGFTVARFVLVHLARTGHDREELRQ